MLKWVSVNLTRTREQKPRSNSLGQTQHIQGTHHISLVIMESRTSKFNTIKQTQTPNHKKIKTTVKKFEKDMMVLTGLYL
jgi:hypothetical protein